LEGPFGRGPSAAAESASGAAKRENKDHFAGYKMNLRDPIRVRGLACSSLELAFYWLAAMLAVP